VDKIDDFEEQAGRWDRWAPFYDADSRGYLDPEEAVDALASYAGVGPVLELGIGSGRLAAPLAKLGLRVDGIDASEQMVARLRERAAGLPVQARIADMAAFDTGVERYPLIFVAASTLFMIGSQDRQVGCFRSAAAALTTRGRFVVEASTPAAMAGPPVVVRHVDDDHVRLTMQTHDLVGQRVVSQELHLASDGRWRMLPAVRRYASPAELDLMAQLAGLRLSGRYGGWDKKPFTAANTRHVSIYTRAE
jgi:SAM-dependent methyltransferase